jgi:hypothetical protein
VNTADLTAAAAEYAGLGWACFPITRSKTPLAGSHGYLDASTDPAVLVGKFSHPDAAGLAIATGPSNLVCIDVDPRNGGMVTAAQVLTGEVPSHPVKLTPRGGVHHVFPVLSKIATRANALGPGIDVEAAGPGVMFCPPTRGYAWAVSPFDVETPHLPLWVWRLLPKVEAPPGRPRRPRSKVRLRFTLEETLEAASRLGRLKKSRDGWLALCPAHDDRHHSLSIKAGSDGKPVLWCFACCSSGDGGSGFHRVAMVIERLVRGVA